MQNILYFNQRVFYNQFNQLISFNLLLTALFFISNAFTLLIYVNI